MADIMASIQYPVKDKDWVTKHLYSFVGLIPIVGSLAMMGYQVKAIRECARGETKETLPEWDNWMELLSDGFLSTAIAFIYMVVPLCLMFISVFPFIMGFLGISDNPILKFIGNFGPFFGLFILLISVLLMIIGTFLLPMAIGVYALTGSFFEAINVPGIIGKISSNFGSYIMVYLVPFGLSIVWSTVAGVIMAIPLLGQLAITVLVFPVSLYMGLVTAKLLGDMVREKGMFS